MKKGFTLIELLAVIVILAIIALIATPIVLGIIDDAKESAMIRSSEMYLSGVEQAIMRENMNAGGNFKPVSCDITSDGNLYCDNNEDIIEIEMNGELPKNGKITFENGKIKEAKLIYETATIVKNRKNELVKADCESLGNYEHKLKDGTIESHDTKEGNCSKCGETVLAPGLYDENDNLMISWSNLLSKNYQPITYWYYEDYYDEEKDEWICIDEERTSGILNIDSNGNLSGAFDSYDYINKSSEYLTGKLVIDDSVTGIKDYGFSDCVELIEIIVPNSVTSIGSSSFANCTSLLSIEIPDSVEEIDYSAFSECTSLTEIEIPNNLTTIKSHTFYNCRNLTKIEIPNNVTQIENYAFSSCTGLTEINFPTGLTSIGNSAFSSCTGLTEINFPTSLTSIGNSTFSSCTGLTEINFPTSLTSIGNYAFSGCTELTEINFPTGLTSIGNYAFSGCIGLTEIYIPKTVTNIGITAFSNCSQLNNIKVDLDNTAYDSRNDCNAIIETATNKLILGCKHTIIPDSVEIIEDFAFSGCTELTEINLPAGLISIGNSAFRGCTGLTEINLPAGLTSIGSSAFSGCTGLTKIKIPDSVETITASSYSTSPFYNCSENLMIHCDINSNEIPSGWSTYWRAYKSGGCGSYYILAVTWADGTVTNKGGAGWSCPF